MPNNNTINNVIYTNTSTIIADKIKTEHLSTTVTVINTIQVHSEQRRRNNLQHGVTEPQRPVPGNGNSNPPSENMLQLFSFVYGFEWDEIGDFILSLQNPSLGGLYQKGYIDFLDFEVPEYQTHDLSIR